MTLEDKLKGSIQHDLLFGTHKFELEDKHLENCKVVSNRINLLDYLPKESVCAELGVLDGKYTKEIISRTNPTELVLVDIDSDIENVIKGDSVEVMNTFEDNYFDWVYIDTDHSYELTKKELEVCSRKVKDDGYIALHDYIWYDYFNSILDDSDIYFGVVKAVNEFILSREDYEVKYLTLESGMYNTIVIRKINGTER
tara:strand:- start:292 stop:885 length:594 start_codon:yes stop_codon:yes gene_type:complete